MKLKKTLGKFIVVDFDKAFLDKLNTFLLGLVSKNKENEEWMASHLYGVHRIRFTDVDFENMYHLFEISERELSEAIKDLDCVNEDWNVVTHPFNVLLTYAMMIIYSDRRIKKNLKEDLIRVIGIILQFRMSTSLYVKYVTVTISEDLAQQLYEQLDNNSLLKKTGSNLNLLTYKSEMLYTSRPLKKMLESDDCDNLRLLIGRIYNDLNSIHKLLRGFIRTIMEEEEVRVTKSVVGNDDDGEITIIDSKNIHYAYVENLKRLVMIERDWENQKLLKLTEDAFYKSNHKIIFDTIHKIHLLSFKEPDKINTLLDKTLAVSIDHVYNTKLYPPYADRVSALMRMLKGYWSNSNSKDKRVNEVKNELYEIVSSVTNIKTKAVLKNATIVVAIYIFILTIINHDKEQ